MKTDAVYARQSVEKKDSLSIAGQIDLCRRTADGGELRVYKDAGYSGKNTERPAFQQLMKDIRADRIGTLYVYRLDRFSRSVADFGQLWEVLQEHHVEFVSVNENFDTKTPMGAGHGCTSSWCSPSWSGRPPPSACGTTITAARRWARGPAAGALRL